MIDLILGAFQLLFIGRTVEQGDGLRIFSLRRVGEGGLLFVL